MRLPARAVPSDFRRAAVLLPFWPDEGGVRVLLTERSSRLRSHAGQVSFPGGHVDASDASDREAALREAREEVGLDPDQVRCVVALDEAWSGARTVVVPFIAWLDAPPQTRLNPDEVARVLIADVEPLLEPGALERLPVEIEGEEFVNYAYVGSWGRVVGLSADLLMEALLHVSGVASDRAAVRLDELERYTALQRTRESEQPSR